ncbi:hypothetical protein CD351_10250 [Erythrobacter sp. KY5]|uniref:hypothetical protein n=1 Tax=Erythrobacter sp. KY5 TaxID=2011159 RepID=UPI000DBF08C7|nr:hypothetical protein [Erythrobacter sp. KY5]AWW74804.1 hypothetical protein CD351_10250 [Erythrobacter sp. KY5]
MLTLISRKRASSFALAISLATGTAVIATAVFPTEASAQRRDRDRDRDRDQEQEADGGGYSDAFRAAYVPLDEAMKAEGGDITSMRAQFEQLAGVLNTSDEKIAGGGLIFNAGIRLQDRPLQLLGMENMLASGKVPAEQAGRYNFIAYQLSNEARDYAKARRYLQGAIDNNFTTDTINASSLRIAMAESFFADNDLTSGFNYLQDAIADRKASGQPVDEQWYRRGVTVAYENQVVPTVYDFVTMWISDYPSSTNWRDAINVARNLNNYEGPEILDLFRLSRRVGALTEASDYDYYVEAADARRLPREVKDVIDEGMAAGIVSSGNLFITEALETATGRIQSDRADLPALERDAMAADAGLRTVVAAGSAFLSYDEFGKAETFYQKALGMAGVNTNEALTRLGIAKLGLGKYDEARTTFGRVTGNRESIAKLWIAYANELEKGTAGAAAQSAASVESM